MIRALEATQIPATFSRFSRTFQAEREPQGGSGDRLATFPGIFSTCTAGEICQLRSVPRRCSARASSVRLRARTWATCPPPTCRLILTQFYRFLPIVRTFLGDFNPQKLPSRRLQTPWEWKNRVLLEEYYIFNVAIPLEVE